MRQKYQTGKILADPASTKNDPETKETDKLRDLMLKLRVGRISEAVNVTNRQYSYSFLYYLEFRTETKF